MPCLSFPNIQNPYRKMTRYLSGMLTMFFLCAFSISCFAVDSVTIVLSEEGGAYSEFATHLQNTLVNTQKTSARIIHVNNLSNDDLPRQAGNQLFIAVGTPAMVVMAQKPAHLAVLNVLVPRASFMKTARQYNRQQDSRRFSAVFMDQSWTRQLRLIRISLAHRTRVGILLGKESTEYIPAIQSAAKEVELSLHIETVTDDAELLNALRKLLANSDAILAVPDAHIYNRNNLPSILLTSYRQQIPLFGFSPSYVKAGALAAVYSQPAQISQQVAELIASLSGTVSLPPPQFPRYFSVNTNPQVARSLSLNIEPEAELQRQLRQQTEQVQ